MSYGWLQYMINSWKLRAIYGPVCIVEKDLGMSMMAKSNSIIIKGDSGMINTRFFSYAFKLDGMTMYFESKDDVIDDESRFFSRLVLVASNEF